MSNKKKLILLAIWAIVSISGYLALCVTYDLLIMMIYIITASGLIVAFTILNRGFEKQAPTDDEKELKRREYAQLCALIAFPMILAVLFDIMLVMFGYSLPAIVYNLLY